MIEGVLVLKVEDPINIMMNLEKKFNLFDIEIRNLKIWYFCRQEVNYVINSSINFLLDEFKRINGNKRTFKMNFKVNEKKALLYLRNLTWGINNYKKTDILCLSSNNMRREIKDGKEFDIIFDYIGVYLKDVSYSILNTFSGKQFTRGCYTENCYNLTNYCLNIYLYKRYYKFVLTKEEIAFIKYLFHEVEEYIFITYNIKVNITKTVLRNVSALIKSYEYAYNVIKKMDPKVLYVECAYSNLHLPFIQAAKNLGIKVVEFQHGVISNRHLGYLFNDSDPKNNPIPDYICLYGRYSKRLLEDMNPNLNIKLIEYGYPYLNEKVKEVEQSNRYKEYKYLITTQGQVNYKYWRRFIKDLLGKDEEGKILVKLHPNEINQYRGYYSNLLDNDRVDFTINKNIYECLECSEVHLSSFSTCHYEAICCNVETIVVMFPGWEHVNILREYGVEFIKDAKELINYLHANRSNILFEKFKKDFFNIENNDEIKKEDMKKRIINLNNYFLKN